MAWIAIPAAVGTLRISDAIPLTKSPEAERQTMQGALGILLLMATLGGAITIVVPGASRFVSLNDNPWLFSIGFAFVAATGISRIAVMLATKHGWFNWIATLGIAFPAGTFVGQFIAWRLGGTLVEGSILGAALAAAPAACLLARRPPSFRAWPLAVRAVLINFPEFARLAVPFAAIDTLRIRVPYLIAGLPSSGVGAAHVGYLQQAERVSGWPRMGLSAILRPLYQHAAARDHVSAASQATDITIRMLVVASGPVAWAVLNAAPLIRVVLGPGWEGAVTPFRLLLAPAVVFVAADFTDRLFDMHRRQGLLLAISVAACLTTVVGSVLFALFYPSLNGIALTLGGVMLAYSAAVIFTIGTLGGVAWRPYRRPALALVFNAALVLVIQYVVEYAAVGLGVASSALLALLLAAIAWRSPLVQKPPTSEPTTR